MSRVRTEALLGRATRSAVVTGVATVAVTLCLGCDSRTPNRQDRKVGLHSSRLLEIRSDRVQELGLLQIGERVEKSFQFRNVSSETISVALGNISCSCLKTVLQPGDGLLKPNEEGTVVLTLVAPRTAGLLRGSVQILVNKGKDAHNFVVKGIVEGLAPNAIPYVVRPTAFRTGKLPPLKLTLFSREPDTDFQILSVKAHEGHQYFLPVPEGKDEVIVPQLPDEATPEMEMVDLGLDELLVGPPRVRFGDAFERTMSIPVSVRPQYQSAVGHFVIQYRFRAKEMPPITTSLTLVANERHSTPQHDAS